MQTLGAILGFCLAVVIALIFDGFNVHYGIWIAFFSGLLSSSFLMLVGAACGKIISQKKRKEFL